LKYRPRGENRKYLHDHILGRGMRNFEVPDYRQGRKRKEEGRQKNDTNVPVFDESRGAQINGIRRELLDVEEGKRGACSPWLNVHKTIKREGKKKKKVGKNDRKRAGKRRRE